MPSSGRHIKIDLPDLAINATSAEFELPSATFGVVMFKKISDIGSFGQTIAVQTKKGDNWFEYPFQYDVRSTLVPDDSFVAYPFPMFGTDFTGGVPLGRSESLCGDWFRLKSYGVVLEDITIDAVRQIG
tara:strand:+ start:10820 stop:11206 length:387 start_codon:yes stop_codon:yes gene_type:complete